MIRASRTFVTPDMAAKLLRHTPNQRPLNLRRVARYAADMTAGAWLENGETVKLDEAGVLVNGHHRMKAVVLSGCSVWMWFMSGVEVSGLETMDAGLPKRISDWSTHVNAVSGYSICSAVARFLSNSNKAVDSVRVKNAIWDLIGDDSIQFAISSTRKSRIARAAPACMAVALVHRIREDRAVTMSERLSSLSAPEGSPEHSYIRQRSNHRGAMNTHEHAAIGMRIAVAAVRDEQLAIIRSVAIEVAIRDLDLGKMWELVGEKQ